MEKDDGMDGMLSEPTWTIATGRQCLTSLALWYLELYTSLSLSLSLSL